MLLLRELPRAGVLQWPGVRGVRSVTASRITRVRARLPIVGARAWSASGRAQTTSTSRAQARARAARLGSPAYAHHASHATEKPSALRNYGHPQLLGTLRCVDVSSPRRPPHVVPAARAVMSVRRVLRQCVNGTVIRGSARSCARVCTARCVRVHTHECGFQGGHDPQQRSRPVVVRSSACSWAARTPGRVTAPGCT